MCTTDTLVKSIYASVKTLESQVHLHFQRRLQFPFLAVKMYTFTPFLSSSNTTWLEAVLATATGSCLGCVLIVLTTKQMGKRAVKAFNRGFVESQDYKVVLG